MENTEKHTKGEWKIDRLSGHIMSGEITVAIPHGSAGRRVHTHDEHEANAKLIAAAPYLLQALKIANTHMEHRVGDCYSNDYMGSCVCGKGVVEKAIKKATE